MRWLNLSVLLFYLSVLLTPQFKALSQQRLDVISGGTSVQNAVLSLSSHLTAKQQQADSDDDHNAEHSRHPVVLLADWTAQVSIANQTAQRIVLPQPRAPPFSV